MNPDNTFFGAYLKVQRADYHLNDLTSQLQPLATHLYEVAWIKAVGLPCASSYAAVSSNPDSKILELAFLPKLPIREYFALLIGDIVHNLHAALDYATTAIVRAAGLPTKFVTFPAHEEQHNLTVAQTSGLAALQRALPGVDLEAFFQDTIKSYRDGNNPLWTIGKLDKIDKHNFILPTIAIAQMNNGLMCGVSGGISFVSTNKIVWNDASRPFGFVRVDATNGLPEHTGIEISTNLSFPPGEFFSGMEVTATLTAARHAIMDALQSMEQLAISAGLYSGHAQGNPDRVSKASSPPDEAQE